MVEYEDVLKYIAGYWPQLILNDPPVTADGETLIGLPRPYLIPSRREFAEMYYWDSYFMALGVMGTEHEQLVLDMAENCAHIIERFGFIPNATRYYFTSRSQPPFFTKLFRLGYDVLVKRDDPGTMTYLDRMRKAAAREHSTAWLGTDHRHQRKVYRGLSRYRDVNANDFNASCESGWDHSTRCDGTDLGHESGRWQSFLPVCLNAILYAREKDLQWAAETMGDTTDADLWRERAATRAATVKELMWSEEHQFFYDYEYARRPGDGGPRIHKHESLAGFFPLWAGLATRHQADGVVRYWLPKFLRPGGLVTSLDGLPGRQWAAPNGWAPLQWIAVAGLERYGYRHEAQVVRRWWCDNCAQVFRNGAGDDSFGRGTMLEKYNVEHVGKLPEAGLYGTGIGFGWSNAVFVDFARALAGG